MRNCENFQQGFLMSREKNFREKISERKFHVKYYRDYKAEYAGQNNNAELVVVSRGRRSTNMGTKIRQKGRVWLDSYISCPAPIKPSIEVGSSLEAHSAKRRPRGGQEANHYYYPLFKCCFNNKRRHMSIADHSSNRAVVVKS